MTMLRSSLARVSRLALSVGVVTTGCGAKTSLFEYDLVGIAGSGGDSDAGGEGSSGTAGDKRQVVGYASVAYTA